MCGIIGWLTTSQVNSLDRRRYIDQALIVDTLRGDDSTGIFAVPHKQDVEKNEGRAKWAKSTCDGYNFLYKKPYQKIVKSGIGDYRAIIGHNRSATVGGVAIETAHPFQEGPITLVHNGTLHRTGNLPISEWEARAANDSHAIAHNLAKYDAEEVIEKIDGAFALVWHDARDDSISIVRNKERPLHMTKSTITDTLFLASEAEMLAWLMKRLKMNHGPIYQPKPGAMLTFTGDKILSPEITQCQLYVPKIYNTSGYNTGGGYQGKGQGSGTTKTPGTSGGWNKSDRTIRSTVLEPNDPKVFVGGRRVPVPSLMQEALMDLDLEPAMEMSYVPKAGIPVTWRHKKQSKTRFFVSGYLTNDDVSHDQLPCVIHGVPASVWNNYGNMLWTVRPVGVRFIGVGEPCIIGKLVKYTTAHGISRTVAFHEASTYNEKVKTENLQKALPLLPKPSDSASKKIYDKMISDANKKRIENTPTPAHLRTYPGKYGATVDYRTFLKDTEGGCVMCGDPITTSDAEDLTWVRYGESPVCLRCKDSWVEEYGDSSIQGDTKP